MKYSTVVDCYTRIEGTNSRNEAARMFSDLIKVTPATELPALIYLTQGKLGPDYMGIEMGVADRLITKAIARSAGVKESAVETAVIRSGDLGDVAQKFLSSKSQLFSASASVELLTVFDTLRRLSTMSGKGSSEARVNMIAQLLSDVTPAESKFIVRAMLGELRLGIADYTIVNAIALAYGIDKLEVESAYNLISDLGRVAEIAAAEGRTGIRAVKITVGVPCRPMLAERLTSAADIVAKLGSKVAAEFKLDGERAQIHKKGEEVVIYSRKLERITEQYPDVAEIVRGSVKAHDAILDAEVVACNAKTGAYLPFQELMHRRRKYGVEESQKDYPVSVNVFDILLVDDEDLTAQPYRLRRERLLAVVPAGAGIKPIPALVSSDPAEIEKFMAEALKSGGEGLVVKDPNSGYKAGARNFAWIKYKKDYRTDLADTMDLVIIGGFHGRGKRSGVYGAFLLAAYDPKAEAFVAATKIGTGFSDKDLRDLTEGLNRVRTAAAPPNVQSGVTPDVWFEPRIVIETVAAEVTLSPVYTVCLGRVAPGQGLALRFPRFTGRIRSDKPPEGATTTEEILSIFSLQNKKAQLSS